MHDVSAQQSFIAAVAPGAMAAQRKYGVPAAVTIAQAIDESGWGLSSLATRDNNLFGIKGDGPAGSDPQPTQEYENGQFVTLTAPFRVYRNVAESIEDHGKLLATSQYYTQSMAERHDPNAFADALTGVYATDPDYGAKLIGLMQGYDLYRYDAAATAAKPHAAKPHARRRAHRTRPVAARAARTAGPAGTPGGATIPGLPPAAPTPVGRHRAARVTAAVRVTARRRAPRPRSRRLLTPPSQTPAPVRTPHHRAPLHHQAPPRRHAPPRQRGGRPARTPAPSRAPPRRHEPPRRAHACAVTHPCAVTEPYTIARPGAFAEPGTGAHDRAFARSRRRAGSGFDDQEAAGCGPRRQRQRSRR